ncbi:MAG: LD-carboxypeptidase [Chloroflexia bacterium]|nr:LD-carboxypeptidase [Chloroflexia bacterium]
MIRPPRLRPGDTVGLVSPSWGGAGAFPHRLERGVQYLQALGFKVRIGRHALNQRGFVSDTPQHRVDDIHRMFGDAAVKAIVAAIGGDHSCHLLPLLDLRLIRENPKVFMGFSDITVLNVAIWKETGLVTFNGPALLTDFAEYPRMFEYTERYMLKALCEARPLGVIEPSTWWTEEFLDWGAKEDLKRPRARQDSTGWTWLRGGVAEGRLIGGCLESLEHLRGTRFWPDWQDAIMFFETSEEAPPPERVDALLMDYENMGVLQGLKGLLVGRPMRYTEEQQQQLREVVLERTRAYPFPIVADMDFGHTAPQFTVPIGCCARIDAENRRFEILDAAVE